MLSAAASRARPINGGEAVARSGRKFDKMQSNATKVLDRWAWDCVNVRLVDGGRRSKAAPPRFYAHRYPDSPLPVFAPLSVDPSRWMPVALQTTTDPNNYTDDETYL